MPLRIVSWNINSVRIRLDLIGGFIAEHQPDMLCLQEIKTENHSFPADFFAAQGYVHQAVFGQKAYHGVAILSRLPFAETAHQRFIEKPEERHGSVRLENGVVVHNFYVPAGGDVPDTAVNEKFKDKLAFVEGMKCWSAQLNPQDPLVILGDFNIAPLEHDVWSHRQLLQVVSHTEPEVTRLNALQASLNWIDCARLFVPPEQKLYSWWSYRARDWLASNRGRRLDHIWVSPGLKNAVTDCRIFADVRGWENPSDHVPVMLQLTL